MRSDINTLQVDVIEKVSGGFAVGVRTIQFCKAAWRTLRAGFDWHELLKAAGTRLPRCAYTADNVSIILKRPSIVVAAWSVLVLGMFAWRGDLSLAKVKEQDQRVVSLDQEPVVVRRKNRSVLPRLPRTGFVFDSMGYSLVGADVTPTNGSSRKTADDGAFSIDLLRYQASDLVVRASGRREEWVRTSAISPDPLAVCMEPSAPWDKLPKPPEAVAMLRGEGEVRGTDRQPLANAYVNVLGTDCWGVTDDSGRFELPLPSQAGTFVLHHAGDSSVIGGFATMSAPFASPRARGIVPLPTLVAEPGGSIHGIVRNEAGEAIAGLPVGVRGPSGLRHVLTSAGGEFVLRGLLPADYTIEPFAYRGGVGEVVGVRVDRASVACDLHLTQIKEASVRVVDENGEVAAGVWVSASMFGLRRGIDQVGTDGFVKLPVGSSSEFEVRMADSFDSCRVREYDAEAHPATLVIAQP